MNGMTKIDMEEAAEKLRNQPPLDLNEHDLVQQSYRLIDKCHGRTISIPVGTNLTGVKGAYKLEKEVIAESVTESVAST